VIYLALMSYLLITIAGIGHKDLLPTATSPFQSCR